MLVSYPFVRLRLLLARHLRRWHRRRVQQDRRDGLGLVLGDFWDFGHETIVQEAPLLFWQESHQPHQAEVTM